MVDIEAVNNHSPYTLLPLQGKEGLYKFSTDYGVKYVIGFMPDDSIVRGAYQFVILNTNNKPSPNDVKIKDVVILLVDNFFECNENALIYICETGDGKQAMRNRLFQQWFSQYDKEANYTFITSSVKDEEDVVNYASLIVKNTNPRLKEIMNEFTDTIQMFRNKP